MDICNDTSTLASAKEQLSLAKNQFGDVNMQMINMINVASSSLEGKQMELAQETTFSTVSQIKNVISNLEINMAYVDQLSEALSEYFSYNFSEVN